MRRSPPRPTLSPHTPLFRSPAQLVEPAGKQIQRRAQNFFVGQNDVAPSGIGTPSQSERIAQAGARNRNGQAILVQMIVKKRAQCYRGQLGKMRCEAHSVVVLLRAKPQRPSAYFFENFEKGADERLSLRGSFTNKSIGSVAKKIGVRI